MSNEGAGAAAKRYYAVGWQNPGNPKAEQEFMRIGSAYESLVNGDTQQDYNNQQHRYQQQNYYNQQQGRRRYNQHSVR